MWQNTFLCESLSSRYTLAEYLMRTLRNRGVVWWSRQHFADRLCKESSYIIAIEKCTQQRLFVVPIIYTVKNQGRQL